MAGETSGQNSPGTARARMTAETATAARSNRVRRRDDYCLGHLGPDPGLAFPVPGRGLRILALVLRTCQDILRRLPSQGRGNRRRPAPMCRWHTAPPRRSLSRRRGRPGAPGNRRHEIRDVLCSRPPVTRGDVRPGFRPGRRGCGTPGSPRRSARTQPAGPCGLPGCAAGRPARPAGSGAGSGRGRRARLPPGARSRGGHGAARPGCPRPCSTVRPSSVAILATSGVPRFQPAEELSSCGATLTAIITC